MLRPLQARSMDTPLDSRLHATYQLVRPAGCLGFLPDTRRRHLASRRLHISLIPTGLIPGLLSSAINQPDIRAQ